MYDSDAPMNVDPNSQNPLDPSLARIEDASELMENEEGWVIGARGHQLLRLPTDSHMITMGKTRSGKGTCVAIPNLLTHEGSVFSVEIGGATFNETVNFRRHVLKQDVHVIDPMGQTGEASASINLLETLDPDAAGFLTETRIFAKSLLKGEKGAQETNPNWERTPAGFLSGLLIYVRTSPDVYEEDRNMVHVAKLLSTYKTEEWQNLMRAFKTDSGKYRMTLNKIGNYFYDTDDTDVSSIYRTVSFAMDSFEDPDIVAISKTSSFFLEDLRNKKSTVYVVMPESAYYQAHAAWLRLLVERSFAACPNMGDGGAGFEQNDRVLFLLDEFTQLGKLDCVDLGMRTAGQKGITIWAMFQDKGILEAVYGEKVASSILGNAAVTQVLDMRDEITTRYIAERLGKRIALIPTVAHGFSKGTAEQTGWVEHTSKGIAEAIQKSISLSKAISREKTWSTATREDETISKQSSKAKSEGIKTSPKNALGLNFWGFRKSDPGLNAFLRAEDKNYNISDTQGDGVAKRTGTTRNEGSREGTTETETAQEGKISTETKTEMKGESGAKTESETEMYSVTYTPHILNKLDPAQVEDILGTGINQILILDAKINGQKQVVKVVEQRAPFYTIPMLKARADGYFALPAPSLPEISVALPEAPSPNSLAINIEDFKIEDFKSDTGSLSVFPEYKVIYPLTSEETADPYIDYHTTPCSPKQYIEALEQFQTTVANTKNKKIINRSMESLHEVFMRAAASIDKEANKIESQMKDFIAFNRKRFNQIVTLERHLTDRGRYLEERESQIRKKQGMLFKLDKAASSFRDNISDKIWDARKFERSTENYKEFLRDILQVSKKWKGIYAPVKPKKMSKTLALDVDLDNLEASTSEIFYENLYDSINIEPRTEFISTTASFFREVSLKCIDLMRLDPAGRFKPRLYNEFSKNILGLPAGATLMDVCKELEYKSNSNKIKNAYRFWFAKGKITRYNSETLKSYRADEISKILEKIRGYQESVVDIQEKFNEHLEDIKKRSYAHISNMNNEAEFLNRKQAALLNLNKKIDNKFERLKQQINLIKDIPEAIGEHNKNVFNRIVDFDEWSELERSGAKMKQSDHDAYEFG